MKVSPFIDEAQGACKLSLPYSHAFIEQAPHGDCIVITLALSKRLTLLLPECPKWITLASLEIRPLERPDLPERFVTSNWWIARDFIETENVSLSEVTLRIPLQWLRDYLRNLPVERSPFEWLVLQSITHLTTYIPRLAEQLGCDLIHDYEMDSIDLDFVTVFAYALETPSISEITPEWPSADYFSVVAVSPSREHHYLADRISARRALALGASWATELGIPYFPNANAWDGPVESSRLTAKPAP